MFATEAKPYYIERFAVSQADMVFGGAMPYEIKLYHDNGGRAYGSGMTLQEAIQDALQQLGVA